MRLDRFKTFSIVLLLLLFNLKVSKAQIALPKGFVCVGGENFIHESHFEDGDFTFSTHPWGHDGLDPAEVPEAVRVNFDILLKRTKDGLFWGTTTSKNGYSYYIVVDGLIQYTLSVKGINPRFNKLSIWLLQQVRAKIKDKRDDFFTDFRGHECYEFKK